LDEKIFLDSSVSLYRFAIIILMKKNFFIENFLNVFLFVGLILFWLINASVVFTASRSKFAEG
jgi:hypothetical protein